MFFALRITKVMMLIVRHQQAHDAHERQHTASLFWSDWSLKFSLSHHSGAKSSEHA